MSIPTTPREDGRKAFAAGAILAANPHKTGTEPHEEWARGWSAAKWAANTQASIQAGLDARPKSKGEQMYTEENK
jgi:hypothetical protein